MRRGWSPAVHFQQRLGPRAHLAAWKIHASCISGKRPLGPRQARIRANRSQRLHRTSGDECAMFERSRSQIRHVINRRRTANIGHGAGDSAFGARLQRMSAPSARDARGPQRRAPLRVRPAGFQPSAFLSQAPAALCRAVHFFSRRPVVARCALLGDGSDPPPAALRSAVAQFDPEERRGEPCV